MSQEEHNAFAKIYRELLKSGYSKRKEKSRGFFAQASARMKDQGYSAFTEKQLNGYAQYRRRIGDVNFPRLRGSQEIERMQVAAIDRNQALGVMATGLMHEILQPLQVIQADAELQLRDLRNSHTDVAKLGERMNRILRQVKAISAVVQHVRMIARAGELKTGPASLHEAVTNALILFHEQLHARGIKVSIDGLPNDLPRVQADAIALERVFINLLTNARDAIEESGRKEGNITIAAHIKDKAVNCEVTDNGTGITPENIARIFDPYFTTKEVGKGTGMGLTEVMNLMIQFGGRVIVRSQPELGATFTLEFQEHG